MQNITSIFKKTIFDLIYRFQKLVDRISRNSSNWKGNYSSWEDAKKFCFDGYDDIKILEKCSDSLLKVKNGKAVYERDSVIFNNIQYSWGLLSGLQKAAIENDNKLCVLDFGGSLGSSYYQNKEFLSGLSDLKWCIVEQPHFVRRGKEVFEDDHLFFYDTIDDCLNEMTPNVLLLSCVIQYLEDPYKWLNDFLLLNIPFIIIDRTPFVDTQQDILTVQRVHDNIYSASYPCWFFNEDIFNSYFSNYKLIGKFESFCDKNIILNRRLEACWIGLLFVNV